MRSNSARYWALAKEYSEFATKTADPAQREQHLKQARTWEHFARKAEQLEAKPAKATPD